MSQRSPTLFKWTLRWYLVVRRWETGITCLHLLHVPTFQQITFHLLVPNLWKSQLTWNCHPTSISQTNHWHPVAHLSDRWSTGPQVHQSCWKLWPRGTCVPVSCGSGSQSEWRTRVFHGTFLQNHVWPTYSTVWFLNWHLRRGASELNICHKKPTS